MILTADRYIGPLAVLIFFIVATVINSLLMLPVTRYTYEREHCEGDFRYFDTVLYDSPSCPIERLAGTVSTITNPV